MLAEEFAFNLPFTQEMMSDALGLSVPHLNRMLTKLRAEGLIAINERRVEFLDRTAMEQLGAVSAASAGADSVVSETLAIN